MVYLRLIFGESELRSPNFTLGESGKSGKSGILGISGDIGELGNSGIEVKPGNRSVSGNAGIFATCFVKSGNCGNAGIFATFLFLPLEISVADGAQFW
jgi:hypothetical protein